MKLYLQIIILVIVLLSLSACAQQKSKVTNRIIVGAEQTESYFHLLEGKSIAVLANQTSLVGDQHLVDTLLSSGISVKKVFGPEHGFRGNKGAGVMIIDNKDPETGLPVISLYGDHKKPDSNDLSAIDCVVFDIQDVGVRFYTYISSMAYMMEACAENQVKMIILDRPNPHGHYVDGPMLKKENASFVGLHNVPVVHGMTVGEYALMINGEGWLKDSIQCELEIIKVLNYDHNTQYTLPIPPSPNLPNDLAVKLYPSLCFFEGTVISVGRGTTFPFQCYGHPDFTQFYDFSFMPVSIPGSALHPKYENQQCFGYRFSEQDISEINHLDLSYLIHAYDQYEEKDTFFNSFFIRLSGTDTLEKQIISGMTADEIRLSWKEDLQRFKKIRKNYLLYPDFE